MVRRAHQRAGSHVLEAHLVAFLGEPGKGVGVHETLHRQVAARRLQVLTEGKHVDVMLTHAVHHFDHFFVGFTQAQHQARLGGYMRHQLLELLQQVQRPVVVRARARGLVQARHGFEVVVEHIRRLLRSDFQCHVHTPAVVRHQGFQLHAWRQRADFADAVGKVLGTTVTQVVAVYRSDHHVLQAQVSDGDRQVFRLVQVQRLRPAVAYVAERATTGADVTHDHEGGGAAREALTQVRAGSFLAHAVQLVLAQQLLDAVDLRRDWDTHANPVGLFRQLVGRDDFHRDARHLLGATQLDPGFHLLRRWARGGILGRYQVGHGFLHSCHIQSIPPVRVVCSA